MAWSPDGTHTVFLMPVVRVQVALVLAVGHAEISGCCKSLLKKRSTVIALCTNGFLRWCWCATTLRLTTMQDVPYRISVAT